jgi:acyl-coenzyme A thioesterase PaaI-like protein
VTSTDASGRYPDQVPSPEASPIAGGTTPVETAGAALFTPTVSGFRPTELARGPWSPDALHGGPVAALVVRAAERTVHDGGAGHDGGPGTPVPWLLVRLTLELLRPVPFADLVVTARLVRPGRSVRLVDVSIDADGSAVAWGRCLLRGMPSPSDPHWPADRGWPPPTATVSTPMPPGPDEGRPGPLLSQDTTFDNGGAELRFVRGSFHGAGPATVWVRLAVPVVMGESPSPAQRAAAAADFGNGVSAVLPFDQWRFVNPDLTVVLERPPTGPWVALEATTALGTPGIGVARSTLFDPEGPCGSAVQTLVVGPRR